MKGQFYNSHIIKLLFANLVRQRQLVKRLPINHIVEWRCIVDFIILTPKHPKRRKSEGQQMGTIYCEGFTEDTGLQYNPTQFVQGVRDQVDKWRSLPDQQSWHVTPKTARLLPL